MCSSASCYFPLKNTQFLEIGHKEVQLSATVMGNDFRALSIYLGLWVIVSPIDKYWVLLYTHLKPNA